MSNNQPVINRLNFDAVLSTEDYTAQQQAVESEIVTRFMLASGFPNQSAQFGIVDAANPSNITSSETTRPLFVSVSTQNSLGIAVNSGYAICPNGALLNLTAYQQYIALSSAPLAGNIFVVIAQSLLNSSDGTTQLNDYQIDLSSQETLSTQITSISYVSGWQPDSNQVPLAVVTVVADSTTNVLSLSIDQTQNLYAFNRPWFSIVATKHESKLGSGTATNTNPHATSINDLTIPGTVGVFQGLTGEGLIISRDRLRNKMVGAVVCNDSLDFSHLLIDSSGTITAGSPYNKTGATYAYLSKFPMRLGSVFDSETPGNPLAAEVIPGTNILVFGPNEQFYNGQIISAQYTSCQALNPPTVVNSNFLTFTQPNVDEAVVSGGFIYPTIADPTLSLEGSGPFARKYTAYLMPSGTLQAFPQVMVPTQSALTGILGTFIPVYPARFSVGLTNTTGSNSLNVTVTITGTVVAEVDSSTSSVTEILTFTPQTGYADQQPGTSAIYDLPGQILVTQNRYFEVTTISVVAQNAGSNPQVQVWAEVEPGSVPEMNDAAPVATIFWNGSGIPSLNGILDDRKISKTWTTDLSSLAAVGEAEYDALRMLATLKPDVVTFSNGCTKVMTEDFEDLRYFDSLRGFQAPTHASGILTLSTNVSLQASDTITLTPSKTISAVTATSLSPAALGQFDVGTSLNRPALSTIIQNIITCINNTDYASGVTAALDSTNPHQINLTLQTPIGIAGNAVALSASTGFTGAVSIVGFTSAYDGYGECYLDREKIGLQSPVIPDSSIANPYQFAYRRRYRSRALATPVSTGAQTQWLIEIHGQAKNFNDQLRIRSSDYTSPLVWNAWQVLTPVDGGAKGLYIVTFGSAAHKVQIEYYGRARGLSVYIARD